MFDLLPMAPPDSILGLGEAFKKDPNPKKINLSVGVYKDEQGQTPILASVKEAERRILESEKSKGYLSIEGLADYGREVQNLLFGADHEIAVAKRAVTAQTPGGTGSLRVAADFLRKHFANSTVWCSKPTWANHQAIFQAAGLAVGSYAYIDAAGQGLDFAAMMESLEKVPAGDVVLLHACCHNPTGIDPTPEQWKEIADLVDRRKLLPLVDFAYQGFGDGLTEDATGLRELARPGRELLVCSSFSKNFGLYSERVGALTVVAGSADAAERALSQVRISIRVNYSNPPQHGAAVVATVLGDPALRQQWEDELTAMRSRIKSMRTLFVATMKKLAPQKDFSFIERQRGMFSFSGLTNMQVDELRTKYAVYVVGNGGRINVAGMTPSNMAPMCEAIAAVL
ncbi:Aspartate transaminase [Pirellula staleyi DSM 6068]|uniref:Aspartate transaminase n=1 Tax=Pirellula staleyi (strain ATCC 27377 / DSM 6068 / ICPB 4128) TaxID=530564 RepID=D2R9D4_PIRSD|nr:amino acid aminotransferase [Pirellula staleyi]ADB17684.1 Aspartate transaminase [Pirellula staleyi DSM 6068]